MSALWNWLWNKSTPDLTQFCGYLCDAFGSNNPTLTLCLSLSLWQERERERHIRPSPTGPSHLSYSPFRCYALTNVTKRNGPRKCSCLCTPPLPSRNFPPKYIFAYNRGAQRWKWNNIAHSNAQQCSVNNLTHLDTWWVNGGWDMYRITITSSLYFITRLTGCQWLEDVMVCSNSSPPGHRPSCTVAGEDELSCIMIFGISRYFIYL